MPCNLRCGGARTYDDVGATRVWIAGAKADDGKRFCTFFILARGKCDPSKPRRGQPKLCIIFRGAGKRVSAKERAAWHPDVTVRFQRKAWADDELCEDHAAVEVLEATAEARRAGRRSVVFFDNLSGHATATHLRNLRHAGCDRHLLPTDCTGELMFIDDGIGARLKNLVGEEQDEWLEKGNNLERWTTGPKEGGFSEWEKRAALSQAAGKAWARLCDTYDFEGSAVRIGMAMTADGSGDDKIKIAGLREPYSFKDADGGPEGEESEAEVDSADEADVDESSDEGEGEEDEASDAMDSSDEEDDTAEWACSVAPAEAPPGFAYAPCPPMATEEEQRALVGRRVLVAHDSKQATGWFLGNVRFYGVSIADKKACPTANFKVTYTKKETGGELCGDAACELSSANYGGSEWWLLLDQVSPA